MKSNKGVTLTALVIYIIVASIVIGCTALFSTYFLSNMSLVNNQQKYAQAINRFNMFFIADVKNNKSAEVENARVVFEDGTVYTYNASEKSIYRNDVKIVEGAQKNQDLPIFSTPANTPVKIGNTTKQIIRTEIAFETENKNIEAYQIDFTLRYW